MTATRGYWDKPVEELQKLSTRHLLALLQASRGRNLCSCAWDGLSHCGDEVLSETEREENEKQFELGIRVKEALASRPHIPRSAESKARTRRNYGGREKKTMRY